MKCFSPVLAVCLGCIVALSPLRKAPLLYDDTSIVGKDPFVMAMWADNGEEADLLNGLWFQPRPVRILTHRLDALVFGDTTAGPHIENIAFHIVIGLLLLSLLRTIGVSRGVSLGAMTLFLLHPVCIESVGILSHRKELLSALWLLAALRLSLSGSAGCGMAAVVALFLAVFSKETAAVFPALWLLMAWERGRRRATPFRLRGASLGRFAAWSLVAAALATLAWLQIRHGMAVLHASPELDPDRAGHFLGGAPWGLVCSAAIRAFPRYLWGFVLPWGHTIDPLFRLDIPAFSPRTLGAVAVWAACLVLLSRLWRRQSRLFAPLAWMVLALSPYLFPPLLRSGGTAAFCDRYAYLPSMGFAWFLAEILPAVARRTGLRGRLTAVPSVLLAALYAGCSWSEAADYRSPKAFWGRACRWNPQSFQSSNNLAYALWKEEGDKEGARREFERMRSLHPGFSFGLVNYADLLASLRETDEALAVVDGGLRHRPGDRRLLGKRASLLLLARRFPQALAAFRAAEAAHIDSPAFQFDYAEVCKRNLLWPEAWRRYRRAARGDSSRRDAAMRHRFLVSDPTPPPGASGIVVVGDSIPHGTGAPGPDGVEHPLSERLSIRLGGLNAYDASIPGCVVADVDALLGKPAGRFPFRPRWCIVWCGHNDAFFNRAADEILFDLSGCVFKIRLAGMKPLVIGPGPVASHSGRDRSGQEATLAELDGKLSRFCASARITFISARKGLASSGMPTRDWLVPEDGVHLSDAGLECVANLCAETIRAAGDGGR